MLAMAPPIPLGGKLFLSFLMVALIGLLLRATRRSTFTGWSAAVALAASLLIVVTLEAVVPYSPEYWIHNQGILAAFVGASCAALLLRPQQQDAKHRDDVSSARTALLACTVGPLLGLTIASLAVLLGNVSPLDRGYTFGVCIWIGLLAGVIGAGLVAMSSFATK